MSIHKSATTYSPLAEDISYNAMLMAIKDIGSNLETFQMFNWARKEAGPSSQINKVEIGIRPELFKEEDIHRCPYVGQ